MITADHSRATSATLSEPHESAARRNWRDRAIPSALTFVGEAVTSTRPFTVGSGWKPEEALTLLSSWTAALDETEVANLPDRGGARVGRGPRAPARR
jgi:hypothetical protein